MHMHVLCWKWAKWTSPLSTCSFAGGSPPAAHSGPLLDEVQAPVHGAEATAGPSAPAHGAPLKQARRRLPASLQRGSMRPPSDSGTPGDLQAIVKRAQCTMITQDIYVQWCVHKACENVTHAGSSAMHSSWAACRCASQKIASCPTEEAPVLFQGHRAPGHMDSIGQHWCPWQPMPNLQGDLPVSAFLRLCILHLT